MLNYQRFVKNTGFIGFINFLTVSERIIILPIITKLLGAENYGIWAQLGVTISLVSPLALLGLRGAIIRFLAAEKNKKEIQEAVYSVLFLIFATASLTALLIITFANPLASFFQCQPVLIKILSFIILFECLILVLLSVFQTFQEIKKHSFFTLFRLFGEVGLIVLAISFGYGLYGAVLSLLIIRVVTFSIMFLFILRKFGIKIPAFIGIKKYLSFGLPRVISSVSYWAVASADRYLIGFFLGVLFVGYYAPAYAIGNIINFFLYPLFFMLSVVLSKSFDENKIREVKTYLKYSLKYFLMIAIPAVFGLSLLSKQLLTIFTTREIAENAYYITPFAALSILLYGLTVFGGSKILMLVKKTKITGTIWLIVALLNLGLNFIFIPRFGIMGAAITTLLTYALAFVLIWYFARKELKFEIDWKFIGKSLSASMIMLFFIIWFYPTGLLKTIIIILLSVLLYGGFLWLFRGFEKKELQFFKNLIS